MSIESITERIFQFVDSEELSYADFAATLDIGAAVVSHMKNGRNKVSLNVYAKILESFPQLNPDWLLLGEGTMYRNNRTHQKQIDTRPADLFNSLTEIPAASKEKSATAPIEEVSTLHASSLTQKQIKRIVVFYDDNSFQELMP